MRRITGAGAAVVLAIVTLAGCASVTPKPEDVRVELNELLKAVQQEIKEAESVPVAEPALGNKRLDLSEIKVTVAATIKVSGGGELKVEILPVSADATVSREATHTFAVTLTPPPPQAGVRNLAELKEFARAVYKIKDDLQQSQTGGFVPTTLTADLKFVFTTDASGKIGLKVVPVGISGGVSSASTHTVGLTFNAK